ncbi:hypothetical protein B7463_g10195, partial [Scytalidium lignicola]
MSANDNFTALFGAPLGDVSAAFIGDSTRPNDHLGILELAQFEEIQKHTGNEVVRSGVSFLVDVHRTVSRLAKLGLGGQPTSAEIEGEHWATVHDADGVIVVLIPLSTSIRATF